MTTGEALVAMYFGALVAVDVGAGELVAGFENEGGALAAGAVMVLDVNVFDAVEGELYTAAPVNEGLLGDGTGEVVFFKVCD